MTEANLTPNPTPTPTPEPSLLNGQQPTPTPVPEYVPDATKSAEENATLKAAFDKATLEKGEQLAAEKKAADEKAAANDTKVTPFKLEEIKLPDGFVIDETVSKPFVEIVNKYGLGRDAVAELTALQATAMKNVSDGGTKAWSDMQEKWTGEVKADPEIGGEKLPEVLGSISKLVDKYGTPDLRSAMDVTGAGNNPHVIRFLAKVAKDLGEGKFVPAGDPALGKKSAAERLFPNQNPG